MAAVALCGLTAVVVADAVGRPRAVGAAGPASIAGTCLRTSSITRWMPCSTSLRSTVRYCRHARSAMSAGRSASIRRAGTVQEHRDGDLVPAQRLPDLSPDEIVLPVAPTSPSSYEQAEPAPMMGT